MALGPTRSSQEAFPAAPFAAKRRCPSAFSTSCCISGGHCCSSGDIPAHPPLSLLETVGRPRGSRETTPPTRPCRCQSELAGLRAVQGGIPTHPPPKLGANPQGGRVGEPCPSGAALTAKVLWQGRAITLALRALAAMCHLRKELRSPKSTCWPHSLPHSWGVLRRQRMLAAPVALPKLPHPPAPVAARAHCASLSRPRKYSHRPLFRPLAGPQPLWYHWRATTGARWMRRLGDTAYGGRA